MSILDINVNLWGDFVAIFWISQYLEQCIHVWNKINGRIIAKIAKQFKIEPLFFGNNHFELVKRIGVVMVC